MLPRSRSSRMIRYWFASPLRTSLFVFLIGAAVPAVAVGQTTQPDAALDVVSYESELDRVASAVKHPGETNQLRRSLPRSWPVRVGENTVEVSTGWLASDLKKLEEDPANGVAITRSIESHLAEMRKAAAALEHGSAAPANLDAAHTQLDKILSGREFAGAQGPSPFDLWKARVMRWFNEQILRLLSRLHLGAKTGNMLAWVIVGVAFLALLYWVWRTLSPASRRRETPAEPVTESNDPRLWAKDALAAADRGDYREAVHCAYWAAVVHLETLGVLKRDRARTPRESLRLLDPHPHEQSLLREFTRRFELIWYGYRPASAQDWYEARSNLEKIGCLTPSTPATANS
jgi:hypothetical protein